MKNLLRSVAAVVGGLLAAGAVVMALTWLAVQIAYGGDFSAAPGTAYLVVNLSYTFGAAVLGGWLAGAIAGRRPLLHAGIIAAVMLVLSLGGGGGESAQATGVPGWYATALGVLGALGALSGGVLRRKTRSPEAEDTPG